MEEDPKVASGYQVLDTCANPYGGTVPCTMWKVCSGRCDLDSHFAVKEEAYTKFITMISLTVALLVVLTLMAAFLFKLLNRKCHPFARITISGKQETPNEESHNDEGSELMQQNVIN